MRSVALEIRRDPRQPVTARVGAVRPQVRPPGQPRRGAGAAVVQIAGQRVDPASVHLVNLRFDQVLDREAGFVGVRLGVQRAGGIAREDAAGDKHLLKVGIARLHGADNVAHLRFQNVGIGVGVGE